MHVEIPPPLILAAVLIAGSAAIYATSIRAMRGPEDTLFRATLRPAFTLFARLVHGFRAPRPEEDPIPRQGPAILVANHRSGLDPLILGVATRRHVRFLMAREYYEARGLRWGFRALGCIPVNRDGNDLSATKASLRALREGKVIGIFPQGGIREADGSLEGKAGVALLALRTGAPVVPFYIEGSPALESVLFAILKPSRTRVQRGAPLHFGGPLERKPSREELERVTGAILDAINALARGENSGAEPAPINAPPSRTL